MHAVLKHQENAFINNIVIDNSYSRVGIVTTVKSSIIFLNVPLCFVGECCNYCKFNTASEERY